MGLLDWARRVIGAEPTPPTPEQLRERQTRIRVQDLMSQATVGGLTPARYASAIASADRGDITSLVQLLRGLEERDLHLGGILGTRKLAILGADRQILPGIQDDRKAQEIADFVDEALRNLPDLDRILLELLDGIYQPLSAQEIIWRLEGRRYVPADLEWVDPARFCFTVYNGTEQNQLGELRIRIQDGDATGERLTADKYVVHRPPQRSGYPWQMGLGRGIGWISVLGAWGLKWWATSTERDANPFRTALADDTVSDDDRAAVKAGLAALGATGYAMIPSGVDLKIHPASADWEAHQQYVDHLDALKSKAVLGHTGSADSTPGKLGGEEQAGSIRQDILEADAKALANTIRRDLFGPLVRMNFGADAPVPVMAFDVEAGEDLDGLASRVEILSRSGLAIPSAWAYERFGIPTPEPGEDILEAPSSGGPGLPFDLAARHERVALSATDDLLTSNVRRAGRLFAAALRSAGPAWAEWIKPVQQAIRSSETFGEFSTKLAAIGLDPEIIEASLVESQMAAWTMGQGEVAAEAELIRGVSRSWVPMPPEAAAEWLETRGLLDQAQFKRASDAIRARSFTIARHEGELVLDGVRNRLVQALREGQPYDKFAASYTDMMASLGLEPTNPWHLETVYRTNIQTSLSVGRYQRATDPVVMALRPYWQYRTVGDGSVREAHEALDGRIYRADDPVWGTIYPPNGFNCRCTCITLSERQLGGQTIETEIPEGGMPDEGFASNPAAYPDDAGV